jgi:hypothetical protein
MRGQPARTTSRPVTVQQQVTSHWIIMVAGQKIALGRTRAGQTVTVHVADTTITINFVDGDSRTVTRMTSKPVRSFKAQRRRKVAHVS